MCNKKIPGSFLVFYLQHIKNGQPMRPVIHWLLRINNTYSFVLKMVVPVVDKFSKCSAGLGSHSEYGFYYDFLCPTDTGAIEQSDLDHIQAQMIHGISVTGTHLKVSTSTMTRESLQTYIIHSLGGKAGSQLELLENVSDDPIQVVQFGGLPLAFYAGTQPRVFVNKLSDIPTEDLYLYVTKAPYGGKQGEDLEVITFHGKVAEVDNTSE